LFLADPNGGVYTNSGFGINWGPWTSVSGLKTVPGTPITAVAYEDDHDQYVFHFVLLLADYKGEVYTNSDFGTNWKGWTPVSEGSTMPGAPITAVRPVLSNGSRANKITLFLADPNGGVYTNSGFGINWGPWTYISGLKTVPGTPITAVQGPLYGFPHGYGISLFLTDHNGQVYTTSGFGINWGPWTSIVAGIGTSGKSIPGGRITAFYSQYGLSTGSQYTYLFMADVDGGVYVALD